MSFLCLAEQQVRELRALAAKPAIVIIPGCFSPLSFYEAFVAQLNQDGFNTVRLVANPSTGRKDPAPPATMADDAAAVQQVVEFLAEQGKDVLLIAHSYGGVPATEAVRGLSKSHREAEGKEGGIIRLLYTAAFVPTIGASISDLRGGAAGFPRYVKTNGDYMYNEPVDFARYGFGDLPYEVGLAWAQRMPEQSSAVYDGELTYPGYREVPVSYILCEQDNVVPPNLQRQIIDMIEEESGGSVDVHKISTGHFPFLSRPDIVAQIVRRIGGERV